MSTKSATPTAAIILIGDEILSGKVVDENASFLTAELRELGVALRAVHIIPDVVEEIASVVKAASARYDHVFTSGGVGPTHDDLTMEGIARGFGTEVVRHPELEKLLRGFYGEHLVERNLRMADVPRGAHFVVGDGSLAGWPVIAYENVYIFPGVPAILRRKFQSIKEQFRATPYHLRCVFLQLDEGEIAADLDFVVAEYKPLQVGSYPRLDSSEYKVKVTLESKDAEVVERATAELQKRLARGLVRVE